MKKSISILLCTLFLFGMISTATQKKTEAFVGTAIAGYTITQILGYLALSATVASAGYYVTDNLVNPDDTSDYTDFLQQVFNQTMDMHKFESSPPPPEPLGALEQATLLSMLTKQGIEVGKDLYDKLYKFFNDSKVMIYSDYPFLTSDSKWISYKYNDNPKHYIAEQREIDGKWYMYNGYLYSSDNTKWYLPQPDGTWSWVLRSGSSKYVDFEVMTLLGGNVAIYTDKLFTTLSDKSFSEGSIGNSALPVNVIEPLEMPSYGELPNNPFINIDMSPLNGLVSSPQELTDIINGDKVVSDYQYGKITTAFNDIYEGYQQNPNFVGASAPVSPSIDPVTGTQYYGDPVLDEPLIEGPVAPDSELNFWGKVLFWLKAIWQTLRDIALSLIALPGKIILPLAEPWLDPLLNGLRELFVPSTDFITDKIDIFEDNFTFIETFKNSVNWFETFRTEDGYPFVTIDLSRFQGTFNNKPISMGGQTYILDLRFYAPYKPIGDLMITAFIYLMFVWKLFGRLPEIISGQGMLVSTNAKIEEYERKNK